MEKPKCYSYLRFSRPEQRKGDSVRRQLEASAQYAEKHGLVLDESLSMRDEGLSAYRSTHIKKGALGLFMGLVHEGKIPPGSYLLVESMDRLSRDEVLTALQQFIDIVQGGVTIVTLMDSQEYSTQSIKDNPYQIMASLGVMIRANEESAVKSKRLLDAWRQKKANAHIKPMTARTPGWLRLNRDTNKIDVIEDRAAIVRQLFEMAIAGSGVHSIVKWLSKSGIDTWGYGKRKADTWGTSSVNKILSGRTVLGEYQPRKNKVDKDGDAILAYPQVINEELWQAAQSAMAGRCVGRGRTGAVHNLFTGIAKCAYCGKPMRHHTSKSGKQNYFMCSAAKFGLGCKDSTTMQYRQLEKAFLQYAIELDVTALLSNVSDDRELAEARATAATLKGRITLLSKRIDNMYEAIADTDDAESRKGLMGAHSRYVEERKVAEEELTIVERDISRLSQADTHTAQHLESIKELGHKMDSLKGEELIELRKRLRTAVISVVEKMTCFPSGLHEKVVAWDPATGLTVTPCYRDHAINQELERSMLAEHVAANTGRDTASVLLRFRNGHSRVFRWLPDERRFCLADEDTKNSLILGGVDQATIPGLVGLLTDATPKGKGFKDSHRLPPE